MYKDEESHAKTALQRTMNKDEESHAKTALQRTMKQKVETAQTAQSCCSWAGRPGPLAGRPGKEDLQTTGLS
ncbi:hypothetical protein GCM10010392_69140 [Streptomyces clavifer]|nr:hypothetical protein GCM10010392_69140 [Streptomyces clavifer]